MRKTSFITLMAVSMAIVSCNNQKEDNKMSNNSIYPNQTIESIHKRTSVRSYTDYLVAKDTLVELVKAGMAAPSGKDVRPWEFVILTERSTLDSLAVALPYAKMLSKASAAIIVCGNSDTENGGSLYWEVDCSAAAQNILLAAHSMGLGAVWTAAYPYKERMEPVMKALNLPENILPLCVIPVGYPAKEHTAKEKFNENKIHYDKW